MEKVELAIPADESRAYRKLADEHGMTYAAFLLYIIRRYYRMNPQERSK